MNTHFLETFVTLAQLRNFRATARALHATPATISLRIRSLEDELGMELVDRGARSFRLTPGGENLLGFARSVVAAAHKLREAARQDITVQGRVRLGVIETVVHSWLSLFMKRMASDYPELEIDLAVDTSPALRKRLMGDELDIVVRVEGIEHPEITSTALAIYPVQWIARRGLISPRPRDLSRRILDYPILTFARGTNPERDLQEILVGLAQQEGVPIERIRLTPLPSVAAIVQLLKDGYGLAAIPGLFVKDYLETREFVELPVQRTLPSFIVAMCRHGEAEPKVLAAAAAIREACLEYGQALGKRYVKVIC